MSLEQKGQQCSRSGAAGLGWRDIRQGAEEGGPDGSADDEHGLAQGDDLGGAAVRLLDQELGRDVAGGGESDKCLQ